MSASRKRAPLFTRSRRESATVGFSSVKVCECVCVLLTDTVRDMLYSSLHDGDNKSVAFFNDFNPRILG